MGSSLVVDGLTGMFICREKGCRKQFTRKDHLQRHAANHERPQFFCDGCPKGFTRYDLLERHVKRKVCQTSGKVPVDQSGRQDFPSSFSDEKESDISPDGPLASSSAGPSRRRTVNRDQPIIHPPPKRPKTSGRKLTDDVDRYRPLLTTSSSTSIARPAQLPPSTLHPPPLLTSEVIGQEQRRFSPSQPSQPPPSGQAGPPYWNTYSNPPNPHSEYAPPQPQTAHMMQVVPPHHAHPFTSPPDQFQSYSAPNTATASNTEHQSGFMTGAQLETIASQQWGFNQITPAPWDPLPSNEYGAVYHDPPFSIDMTDWANAVVLETTDVPRVQESAERGTTAASDTSAVNPVTVDLLNTEFPELEMHYDLFNDALQSYWTNVAPSFPFVHRGLFKPAETPTQLLVMMAITGAAHFPQPRPDYAKTVQQVRGALVQQCGLEMPITTLQAFCLCHVYDTWYGTSESLFISQCTWPIMVAHSRKKGIGVQDASKRSPVSDLDGIEEEAENAWTAWAQDEERRRAAFCVLMVDTQISGFWNQHPSRQMSIFAHHIGLPCPKSEWEALSAAEWIRTRVALRAAKKARASLGNQYDGPSGQGASNLKPIPDVSPRKKKSTYLPSLHPDFQVSYVSEGYSRSLLSAMAAETTLSFAIDLDHTLGVQMILIGLCAAAWDFRTRGGMGFKLKNSSQSWRVLVLHAVVNLRMAWESSTQNIPPSVENRDMRDTFALSIICVLSDIPMLQVAAGAMVICGATIQTRQHRDAQRRLKMWIDSTDAFTCLWQSSRYLRSALWADWGIYTSWAIYLTTLVVWAHAWCRLSIGYVLPPPAPSEHQEQAAIVLLTRITDSPSIPYNYDGICDLIISSADKLAARGESIDVECSGLLNGLVGLQGGEVGRMGSEGDGMSGTTPSVVSSR